MRLDLYILEKFQLKSRTFADNLIKKGLVTVNGEVGRPSTDVSDLDNIEVKSENEFASLGGDKLNNALTRFNLSVTGLIAADIGASNGGFTDCLLRAGVEKVYAVDVADCALPDYLKNDRRVIVKDKLNARDISVADLGERVDFVSVDVSFISLKLILPSVLRLLTDNGFAIVLIKPQFEIGHRAGKNGVVTDAKERIQTVKSVLEFAKSLGFFANAICAVPKNFKNKNVEYTVLLSADGKTDISALSYSDLKTLID